MALVESGGYPELRVDGKPFFIHSASFFYYRIPRDLWERSLDAHRALGINTIDLPIPWNWHEPREGEFDFDGRSNPRRDLRGLLQLIQERGFRLTLHLGPVVDRDWRHGGYPGWLLARPEFAMAAGARIDGRYPPFVELAARDPDAAAQRCLDHPAHMSYTRRWLARVAQELAPYSVRRTLRRTVLAAKKRQPPLEIEESGPLLLVQLDGGLSSLHDAPAGAAFWRYAEELRRALAAGGLDAPVFVRSSGFVARAESAAPERLFGVMGQWHLPGPMAPRSDGESPHRFVPGNAAEIELLAAMLNTQPAHPPMLADFRAGWPAPAEDERPREAALENALLSSRLFLAHGVAGINHAPLQDSLTPAGYETTASNRLYRFDAALDVNAIPQPGARAVRRIGQLLPLWGELLGSSHKRADFGVIYPQRTLSPTGLPPEETRRAAETVMRLQRLAAAAGLAAEMLDADQQPVEKLLRHPLLLLPVLTPVTEEGFRLSERAQRALVAYVRQGGTLAYYPQRPLGAALAELWAGTPLAGEAPVRAAWNLGQGQVLELASDPAAAIRLAESLGATRAQAEAAGAIATLRQLLALAGAQPVAEYVGSPVAMQDLLVTQRVSHGGTGRLGNRTGGWGLLSVSNLAAEGAAEMELSILSPRAGARGSTGERLRLPLAVPAGESLLLPLHYPLCAETPPHRRCADEVMIAGAELLSAYRDGKTLEMVFYAPARAKAVFRLAERPRRVRVDEMSPEGVWNEETKEFRTEILRGAAPDYLRTVRIDLRHEPFLRKKPDPSRHFRRDFDFAVTDAARFPLAADAALVTFPPLIFLEPDRTGRMVVEAQNYDELGARFDVKVEGPVRGSELLAVEAAELGHQRVDVKPADARNANSRNDDFFNGELRLKGFGGEKSSSVAFVCLRRNAVTPYRFDWDRDGAEEWVLEDAAVRAIVSPAAGGRLLALINKHNGLSLTNSVGLLRDQVVSSEDSAGLFTRAYRAEWGNHADATELRLAYEPSADDSSGAPVEKVIRLLPAEGHMTGGVEARYRVALAHAEAQDPQTVVIANSVPMLLRGARTTRFCWQAAQESATHGEAEETCVSFQPATAFTVPRGVESLAVRTPGSHTLVFAWSAGQLSVEMKDYSALLRLALSPPVGGAGEFVVQFRVREE
jgi:hypothetical protein